MISIHVGQCGNQVASELYQLVQTEPQFFRKRHDKKYVRAVFVDSEPKVIVKLQQSPHLQHVMEPRNCIFN